VLFTLLTAHILHFIYLHINSAIDIFMRVSVDFGPCTTTGSCLNIIQSYELCLLCLYVKPIRVSPVSINEDLCSTKITTPKNMVNCLHYTHTHTHTLYMISHRIGHSPCQAFVSAPGIVCVCVYGISILGESAHHCGQQSHQTDNMKYPDMSDTLACVCYPVGRAVTHKWISVQCT